MYADMVSAGRKRSIKERLNGGSVDPRRIVLPNSKRQRQSEGILRYDTFKEDGPAVSTKVDAEDLRRKLKRKGLQQGTESGLYLREKLSGTMRQQPVKTEKLFGSLHRQPANTDLPKAKAVTERGRPIQKSVPSLKETAPATKNIPGPVASNKSLQKKSELSVDSLLQSLGLEKYSITFKAEEIDMTALMHMTDEDLKTIGLPMGPRKKILLALKSRT